MNPKFCSQCGAPLGEDARFCSQCGTPILRETAPTPASPPISEQAPAVTPESTPIYTAPAQVSYAPTPKPKKEKNPQKRAFVRDIVTKSIVLLLAMLLVLFAFLPIISINFSFSVIDRESVFFLPDVSYSIIGVTRLSILSLSNMDGMESEDEIDSLYDYIDDFGEDLFFDLFDASSFEGLSKKASTEITDNFTRPLISVILKSEMHSATPVCVFAIFGILYLLSALAFLVMAVLSFVGVFTKGRLGGKGIERALCALSAALFVLPIALFSLKDFFLYGTTSVRATLITSFVLSTLILVWLFLSNVIFNRTRFSLKNILLRSFSFVLCILILSMCGSAFFSAKISVPEYGKEKRSVVTSSFGTEGFGLFSLDREDKLNLDEFYNESSREAIDETLSWRLNYFRWWTNNQLKGTEKYMVLSESGILTTLLGAYNLHHTAFLFTLIPWLIFLVACCAAFLLWQSACYFLSAPYCRLACLLSKIVMGVFTACSLALTILMLIFLTLSIGFYGITTFSVSIAAGVILLCIFVGACAFIPSKDYKETIYPTV